ncbi:MAG: EamA family transporter [Candidatus Eremiobacteraeota bacterium]|nr:EamA family transporter [Candidatus Eremiobacteraeota bacterium]
MIAAYAATVGIWGTTWLAIRVSVNAIPPVTGVGLRFVIAGAVLYAAALALGVDVRRNRPPLLAIALLAFTMFGLNYVLTYAAEMHLASGLVAVLYGTLPFFVFGFAHRMLGERVTRTTIVGTLLALAGVAVIFLAGNLQVDALYVGAALVATAFSAFANVYLKRLADFDPFATLPPAMLLAGVLLTAGGIAFEHVSWQLAVSPASLLALLYLAVLGSAVAFYLNHWLLQRIDSGTFGLSALMIPVLAVGVGIALGGERFAQRDLIGGLLVLTGMWFALRRSTVEKSQAKIEWEPERAA